MRKLIEERLVPFVKQRLRNVEENVAKTKKGMVNFFKSSMFKKPERSETEGQKESFKMNR